MTPRNPLDRKLIVDRTALQVFLRGAARDPVAYVSAQRAIEKALAQNNEGWAATPVMSTAEMDLAAYQSCGSPEETLAAMLDASPPLPGTEGE